MASSLLARVVANRADVLINDGGEGVELLGALFFGQGFLVSS